VLAGVAGLAAVETLAAPAAEAAANPMLLSSVNDGGGVATVLTSAAVGTPSLGLANTASGAPLRLAEELFPNDFSNLHSGDMANFQGDLYYTHGLTSGPFTALVFTELSANQVITIIPQRVLDTRTVAGRAHIKNAAGNLDSSGRLIGGHTIEVSLAHLEVAAEAAFGNLTAAYALAAGFATLWPSGARPATASLSYPAKGVIANFAVTGTSNADSVLIYAQSTTHLLLDITAFNVGSAYQILPAILQSAAPAVSAQRLASRAKAGTVPDWYQPR
jgi:hypothetical protein